MVIQVRKCRTVTTATIASSGVAPTTASSEVALALKAVVPLWVTVHCVLLWHPSLVMLLSSQL